ncbi:ATP-binding protein [Streptomyces sp. NPDC101213]|uniref:ATP-binding protein n=1 Tax=Streptomyces sp. NPDC101213 TaxID=3366130 RepID=UPI0037FD5A9D
MARDQMSVCFEVRPGRPVGEVLEPDARRVRMARRVTVARLRYCGLEPLADDAALIASELVTNAIMHSGGRITFTMTVDGGFLSLAVHDQTPARPAVCNVDDQAERGRGLFLAAERGGTWGTSDDGTTTWCRLAVPGGRP